MLFNCQEFSKLNITKKCLAQIKRNMKYKYPDQDVLNVICAGLVYPIDTKWNFKPFYSYSQVGFSKNDMERYQVDRKAPALVHYTSGYKPWNYPDKYLSDDWWETAKRLQMTFGSVGKKIYRRLRLKLFKFQTIRYIKNLKKEIIR